MSSLFFTISSFKVYCWIHCPECVLCNCNDFSLATLRLALENGFFHFSGNSLGENLLQNFHDHKAQYTTTITENKKIFSPSLLYTSIVDVSFPFSIFRCWKCRNFSFASTIPSLNSLDVNCTASYHYFYAILRQFFDNFCRFLQFFTE